MKRSIIMIAIVSVILMAVPSVFAYTYDLNITRFAGYYSGNGGEFSVEPLFGFGNVLDLYDSKAKIIDGQKIYFETFCLEKDEFVSIPGHYYADLSSVAKNGGAGGPSPDPISLGTAWLYHEFQVGTLQGYYYDSTNNGGSQFTNRSEAAGALQNAIWMLEGEINYSSANYFINLVDDMSGYMNDNNWQIPVAVLNLYDSGGGFHQDQLVCFPTPEPATMLLLGFGLLGLGLARRKR